MKEPKHILVIRLSAMGDVAMAMPVVYAFAKAYPEIKITILSKPFFKPIIQTVPNVHFIAAETNGKHKGILGIWRLSKTLKKQGITHVADIHNVLRSKILTLFLGVPHAKIDKGRVAKKALTRAENKILKPLTTTIQRYVSVYSALGFKTLNPEILPKPKPKEKVKTFITNTHVKKIGVAPFAAHQGKQYPIELMRSVIQQLSKDTQTHLYLFGAPSEQIQLEALAKGAPNCTIIAGLLKFDEQINLIAQLDVMLSMDSGNGHLSAMYGVPTVTLWGVTHPYAGFAPFKQEEYCLLSDRDKYPLIPTSVYGNKMPESYKEVMYTIPVKTIVHTIKSILGK